MKLTNLGRVKQEIWYTKQQKKPHKAVFNPNEI
jgi:hypothetical protein